MNAEKMIKTIREHRGPVEVPVVTGDEIWHVIAQKADLIANLERAGSNPFQVMWVERYVVNGTPQDLMRLDVKS